MMNNEEYEGVSVSFHRGVDRPHKNMELRNRSTAT